MTFDLDLRGKRALVTGGTKGIGAAVVKTFVQAGAKVITTARTVKDTLVFGVRYIEADLSTPEGCVAVAEVANSLFGGIDILVHVVGGSSAPGGGFSALDDAEWFKEINLNLMSAVRFRSSDCTENDRKRFWGDSPRHFNSKPSPVARVNNCLCCSKVSTIDLQQKPIQGTRP